MTKSRKRKRKRPPQLPAPKRQHIASPKPQPLQQITSRRSLWERFQNHPAWWLAGAAATLLTLGAAVWQVLQGPELSLPDADTTLPFQAPIAVVNKSWPFYMTHAFPICGIENVEWEGGGGVAKLGVAFTKNEQTLEPNKPAIFQCRIANAQSGKLLNADIYVRISYMMFWFWSRTSDEFEITWFRDSTPPRWIVGHFPQARMRSQ